MGRRLDTFRTAADLVFGIGLLESTRRSEKGISLPYVAVGASYMFCYRYLKKQYVGGFRENPVGFLVFVVFSSALVFVGANALDDESALRSARGGGRLGSFSHRLIELRRTE